MAKPGPRYIGYAACPRCGRFMAVTDELRLRSHVGSAGYCDRVAVTPDAVKAAPLKAGLLVTPTVGE